MAHNPPAPALEGQRSGSIDTLKILAAFLIVISHFVPKYLWNGNEQLCGYLRQDLASEDFNAQIMMLYNTLGHIGNNLFMVCSAWFLQDSRRMKPRKLLSLEFDLVVLGTCWLLITLLFGLPMTPDYVKRNLLPATSYTYWFPVCYMLVYILHPAFNAALEKLDQRQLLGLDLGLLLLYSLLQFPVPNAYFFNPLVGFSSIYFITAYAKRYLGEFSKNRKANALLVLLCAAALVLLNWLNNFIGVRVPGYRYQMARWNHYMNLFVIFMGIGLFNLFLGLNIKRTALIRRLSSLTLITYVITESPFMIRFFKPWLYDWIYGRFDYSYVWLYVLISSVLAFLVASAAGTLYQILFAPLKEWVLDLVMKQGSAAYRRITSKLMQIR